MKKKGIIPIVLGLLLIAAALSILGYNLYRDHQAGLASQAVQEKLSPILDDLEKKAEETAARTKEAETHLKEEEIDLPLVYPDYKLNPHMDLPVYDLEGTGYAGLLYFPAIDLKLPVIADWSYEALLQAPCVISGTPYAEDFVIAGHNYGSHFAPIGDLELGSTVYFVDFDGNVFTYEVGKVEILEPSQAEELYHSGWDMTLYTCTIDGAHRVVVRCKQVETK